VGESAPELILVQARPVLAITGFLVRGGVAVGRISASPSGGLLRFQLGQPLPFLGGDQDDGAMAGAH
jgi:hypothetical protein